MMALGQLQDSGDEERRKWVFLLLRIHDVPGTEILGLKLKIAPFPDAALLSLLIKRLDHIKGWFSGGLWQGSS